VNKILEAVLCNKKCSQNSKYFCSNNSLSSAIDKMLLQLILSIILHRLDSEEGFMIDQPFSCPKALLFSRNFLVQGSTSVVNDSPISILMLLLYHNTNIDDMLTYMSTYLVMKNLKT